MTDKKRISITSLQGKITLMFVALALVFEAINIFYWFAFLEPKLKAEAEAGARAMAQSYAQSLTEDLNPIGGKILREKVIRAMDRILLPIDPSTGDPYILAVALDMDYEVINAQPGSLNISRGKINTEKCIITEIPLYQKTTRELMGVAKFYCSSGYFEHLRKDVRVRFIAMSVAVFILLFLGWWVAALLFRPLRQLAANLKNRGAESYEPLPGVSDRASDEIRMVKLALDELLKKIGERIEERETLIEELHQLRNLLDNVIDSMPSVLVGVDLDSKITQWNLEAERMTGVTADNARGRMLTEVFPELTGEREKVQQALEKRSIQKQSKVPRDVNGETHFFNITVYPLITHGIEGAVIRMDDVTEQMRFEEMMIQSEKMLSVAGLAAGIAHEINNPLAGIIQNVQVMKNRFSGELVKDQQAAEECGTSIDAIRAYMDKRGMFKMIDAVMESGKRAAKIVENMLSFSRKSDVRFAQHNLGELLDKAVELAENDYDLKKKYNFRQIRIIREYDAPMPKIVCEEIRIQQVVLNILKNAAQALAVKKGDEPIITLRVIADGDMALIEIEDNGPGMPEEVRKRVFEPFFTTKDVGVGTGLGLFVSYFIIAENHGGSLTVESDYGKGTKFIIRLPLEKH